jgi:hydroxycarboxylate dehydrogenase B
MPFVQVEALTEFIGEIFQACGAPRDEAFIVADHLTQADLMGVESHGVIRVVQYVREIREKQIVPGAPLTVLKETETTGIVDGGWNFGQVAAGRGMELAIAKARQHRTGCVVIRRCGHAGRLGSYTQFAAEQGFFAFAVCNSPRHGHFVLPWGGREGRLSTNPISYAVPTGNGLPILADFSTAAAPEGKIRLHRNQGKKLPEGWILDGSGRPSTNPSDFYGPPQGAILPFGGETGYRGYALSLLVEILGGTLGGLPITVDQPGNGLAFIVIDLTAFLPKADLHQLIGEITRYLKSSPPAPGFEEVLLPGEPEFRRAETRLRTGIAIHDATWEATIQCGLSLGVEWRHGAAH